MHTGYGPHRAIENCPIYTYIGLGQWYLFIGPPGKLKSIHRKLPRAERWRANLRTACRCCVWPRPARRTASPGLGTGEKTASKEPILAEREHNICGGPALSFYTAGASLGAPLTFWTNALDHAAALQRFKRRLGPQGDLIQKKVTEGTPLTW